MHLGVYYREGTIIYMCFPLTHPVNTVVEEVHFRAHKLEQAQVLNLIWQHHKRVWRGSFRNVVEIRGGHIKTGFARLAGNLIAKCFCCHVNTSIIKSLK